MITFQSIPKLAGLRSDKVGQPLRLLFVGMDEEWRQQWLHRLPTRHWQVRGANSGAAAFELLAQEPSELLLVASHLPDLDVAEFEEMIRAEYPHLRIIRLDSEPALTQSVTVATLPPSDSSPQTVATLQLGGTVPNSQSHDPAKPLRSWHELVGGSASMQKVYRSARIVARRNTTVLIQGESGTGKDLLARGIHAASLRDRQPFVVINCAAIPEALLEAELFGHTKGAFTGAAQSRLGRIHAAHGGTLFLDEIGDMPLPLQSKILRFLEQGEVQRIGGTDTLKVDCRVIAATNVNLKESVKGKQFREDLYYRLAIFPIVLPPLRERMEDFEDLLAHFGSMFCPGLTVSPEAQQKLRQHEWPGNVRELRNVLERASLYAEDRRESKRTTSASRDIRPSPKDHLLTLPRYNLRCTASASGKAHAPSENVTQGSHQSFIFGREEASPRESWLTEAFSEFIAASARLELSYRELQSQVAALKLTISEKDKALNVSRTEVDTISHLLHELLQILPCGVIVQNGRRGVQLINPEAARLFGLIAAELPTSLRTEANRNVEHSSSMASLSSLANQDGTDLAFSSSAGHHAVKVRNFAVAPCSEQEAPVTITVLEELKSSLGSEDPSAAFGGRFLPPAAPYNGEATGLTMEEVEVQHLKRTLEQVGGNRTKAAKILRISVRSLSSKIKQYDLPPRRYA